MHYIINMYMFLRPVDFPKILGPGLAPWHKARWGIGADQARGDRQGREEGQVQQPSTSGPLSVFIGATMSGIWSFLYCRRKRVGKLTPQVFWRYSFQSKDSSKDFFNKTFYQWPVTANTHSPLAAARRFAGISLEAATKVFKPNDWDQPEIQYSTGASNQVRNAV